MNGAEVRVNDGQAFVYGGIAALAGWGLLKLSCTAIGGYAHINFCGGAALFIVGGIIGLVVNYFRLKRDGGL